MGISEIIKGRQVYLDTNIFIYAFEGYPAHVSFLQELFTAIDEGKFVSFTSELTLAELLVKPLIDKKNQLAESYINTLQTTSSLVLLPVTRGILITAAKIRSEYNRHLKLPDAIHLASAQQHGCETFLSNDRQLALFKGIDVVILDDLLS
jgi:predicted nucleic acid-binding protein